MHVLQMSSGIVDAIAESAIIVVSVLLSVGTLERIRGLCLEHKLRCGKGKVVSLQGSTLTVPETIASLLVLIGLPVATLLTSIGRNGSSAPVFSAVPAVVDVWDADFSMKAFYRDAYGARATADSILRDRINGYEIVAAHNSVLACGTGANNFTKQGATVVGKTHCPGSFKVSENYATSGFVYSEPRREKPPESLFPPQTFVLRSGDWRSQCLAEDVAKLSKKASCFAWKWTQKEISVCTGDMVNEEGHSRMCSTFKLRPGAPLVDSDKAGRKIAEADQFGRRSLLTAHFTVTTTKNLIVDLRNGEKQVTHIEPSSAIGLFSVLAVSILAWFLCWLAAYIAAKRRGYCFRLHTYSGLSAYTASLEDKYGIAAVAKCTECNFVSAVDAGERLVGEGEIKRKLRPYIRLMPGEGHFAGFVCIGHSPDLPGAKVEKGKIGTRLPSIGIIESIP